MILPDINVLIYAHRTDHPAHKAYLHWLEDVIEGTEEVALPTVVMTGFVRIMTDPRILPTPMPIDTALAVATQLRSAEGCVLLEPGPLHWETFDFLCRQSQVKGKDISDAHLAALAIEHGCELVTSDRGFARFPGLRWRHPF